MRRWLRNWVLALLPLTVVSFVVALRFPDATESLYSQSAYPWVARAFASVNRVTFSLAEIFALVGLAAGLAVIFRIWRGRDRRWARTFSFAASSAASLVVLFFLLWGFNYARPSLATRSALSANDVDAAAVISAGTRAAELASSLYQTLETQQAAPSVIPFTFEALNRELDAAFEQLKLPGDPIDFEPTPVKPLSSSLLWSYLGISGIFIPFTGEPSVNVLQPDAALPIVIAHEKAHQRGVTHEGEANFAAFLACAQESSPPYLRYAAYLFATRYLLGEASSYLPQSDLEQAWAHLDEGPTRDVRAIHEFWRRYEGPASRAASRANDHYLKTLQVPGGAESYGTVVQLLMALDARGKLFQ
jgi:hypothetical protein